TLRITTMGSLTVGSRVNLERPLRPDGRVGGHFVQGHVDGTGRIDAMRREAESLWITISFPFDLARYMIPKGSIAVAGVGLTIARLEAGRFDVQIIPYTLDHTNLSASKVGDSVNLEADMIGKYAVRAVELGLGGSPGSLQ